MTVLDDLKATLPARIASRIAERDGCVVWTGAKNPDGYGRVVIIGDERGRYQMAHRVVYELTVGPIPAGLQTDHLCRVRACVRPDHLELVTLHENIRRGTNIIATALRSDYCVHGHPLFGDNLKVRQRAGRSRPVRECRTCRRERKRRYYDQRRAA